MEDSVNQNPHTQHDASVEPLTREKRRWHNCTTSINALPNELLALIFDFGVRIEAEDVSRDNTPKETLYIPLAIGACSEATEEAENGAGSGHDDSGDEDSERDSDSGSESDQDPSPRYQGIQVLASHVCSRWRECSLSIPTLWSHIHISDGASHAKTQEWLIRSGRAPLEIKFDFVRPGTDPSHPVECISQQGGIVAGALDAIIPHISRWKALVFHGGHSRLLPLLLQKLDNKEASNLEKLVLENPDSLLNGEYRMFWSLKLFTSTRLRHLSLHAVHLDWERPNLGGANLTSLILEYQDDTRPPTILEFLAALESSPNLSKLALTRSGPLSYPEWTVIVGGYERGPPIHPYPHTKVRPVLLPRLEQLSLSLFEGIIHINRIIELIQAPALLKLTLKDLSPSLRESEFTDTIWAIASTAEISQHTPWEEVQNALSSPRFPRLEDLSIERVFCSSFVAYWYMFHSFRLLKRLHIAMHSYLRFGPVNQASVLHCFLDPSLTAYILPDKENERHRWLDQEFGPPCPLLEEFQCSGLHTTTVMAFVQRRNEIGKRLRTMRFHVEDRLSEVELDGLYSLVDNLVECETPDDWEELETPSGSEDSEGSDSEMEDDDSHDTDDSEYDSDEHEGGTDGGDGDIGESGDSE